MFSFPSQLQHDTLACQQRQWQSRPETGQPLGGRFRMFKLWSTGCWNSACAPERDHVKTNPHNNRITTLIKDMPQGDAQEYHETDPIWTRPLMLEIILTLAKAGAVIHPSHVSSTWPEGRVVAHSSATLTIATWTSPVSVEPISTRKKQTAILSRCMALR